MSPEELVKSLGLTEGRHFKNLEIELPVIDSHLYTSLGKELFDLYEKYKVSPEDQRQVEALNFLLMGFVFDRNKKVPPSFMKRMKKKIFS